MGGTAARGRSGRGPGWGPGWGPTRGPGGGGGAGPYRPKRRGGGATGGLPPRLRATALMVPQLAAIPAQGGVVAFSRPVPGKAAIEARIGAEANGALCPRLRGHRALLGPVPNLATVVAGVASGPGAGCRRASHSTHLPPSAWAASEAEGPLVRVQLLLALEALKSPAHHSLGRPGVALTLSRHEGEVQAIYPVRDEAGVATRHRLQGELEPLVGADIQPPGGLLRLEPPVL